MEWYDFWDQVPGQDYREDFTPEVFFMDKSLNLPDLRQLSEALAADLEEIANAQIAIGFIITLREKIDNKIDQLNDYNHDPKRQKQIKRSIEMLSIPFYRFQRKLSDYRKLVNT